MSGEVPRFLGRIVWVLHQLAGEISKCCMNTHSSSSAFYFFTSLIPLLTILMAAVSYSGITPGELMSLIDVFIPEVLWGFVESLVNDAYTNAGMAVSVSIVTLVYSATKGLKALMRGLNAVYSVEETRGGVRLILTQVVGVIVLVALLSGALYVIFDETIVRVIGFFIKNYVEQDKAVMIQGVVIVVLSAFMVLLLFYTFLPAGTRKMKDQLPGAVFCAVAWFVLSYALRLYVDNSSHLTLLYGSVSTVMIFLLWLYWFFYLMLAGGLINRLHSKSKGVAGVVAAPVETQAHPSEEVSYDKA